MTRGLGDSFGGKSAKCLYLGSASDHSLASQLLQGVFVFTKFAYDHKTCRSWLVGTPHRSEGGVMTNKDVGPYFCVPSSCCRFA